MAKRYNLTDKMDFETSPIIEIKDVEIEVITDAKTVLKLVDMYEEVQDDFVATRKAYDIIFSDTTKKKIDKLKLNAHDFSLLLNTAVAIAMGTNPDAEDEGNE